MPPISRIRSWAAVPVIAVAVASGTVVTAYSSTAAASASGGPVSVPAGRGCPAGMRAWVPRVTAITADDAQALTPGNLPGPAGVAFGRQAARMLAGHRVHWLGATGCRRLRYWSGAPSGTNSPARGAGPDARALPGRDQAGTPTANWSGYESDQTTGFFSGASMTWAVPPANSTVSGGTVSIWPGIGDGGVGQNELVQAGTQTNASGSVAWTELFPLESEQDIGGFPVSAGDQMAVNVAFDASSRNAAFLVVDYTTDKSKMITQHSPLPSGDQAEWIVERPTFCENSSDDCLYSPLMKFPAEKIVNGVAEWTSSGATIEKYIGQTPGAGQDDMTTCAGETAGSTSPPVAQPGSVDSEGDFTDTWKSSGPATDPAGCQWNVSPNGGTFTGDLQSQGQASFVDTTAKLSINCPASTISGTTGTSPVQGVPGMVATINSGKFSGCTDTKSDIWSGSVASSADWGLNAVAGSFTDVTTGTTSGLGINMTGDVGTQDKPCSFQLTNDNPNGTGKVTFTATNFHFTITGAALTVSGVTGSGCTAAGVKNNDAVTLSVPYATPNLSIEP